MTKPASARPKKPQLTDAERHKRFVETAREVGAEEDPAAFDQAFAAVVNSDKPERRQ